MKKTLLGVCTICVALMLNSCYSSTVCVGNMDPKTPAIKVNTKHNSHFLGGLIGSGKIKAKDYMEDAEDYKVKHQITFLDCVISSVTLGIYTPSTTKFYIPLRAVTNNSSKGKKKARNYDDD